MPRNKYPEETVQKIFDASLRLFLEKGYEKTTVLDIVGNLGGLTRGAFYHHFKSKEEVLDALTDKVFREDNPFEQMAKETGISGLEKIKRAIVRQRNLVDPQYQKLVLATMSLVEKNPQFLAKMLGEIREVVADYLQPLIEEGIADGSIRSQDPKLLGELMQVLTNVWMNPSVFPCTETEALGKLRLVKQILDDIGFPVLDETVIACITGAEWNFEEETGEAPV